MNDEEFLLKLREAFAIEAEEHLQAMGASLMDLEKGGAGIHEKEIVETIFREAHSLKGAARAVNRTDIEAVCQAMESVFSTWKRDGARTSAEAFDTLSAALDFVAKLRLQPDVGESAGERFAVTELAKTVGRLSSATPGRAPAEPSSARPPPAFRMPTSAAAVPTAQIAVAERLASEAGAAPSAGVAEPPDAFAPPEREPEKLRIAETIRVPVAKMDALLLQAEEMVALKLAAGEQTRELREIGAKLERWEREAAKFDLAQFGTADAAKQRDFLERNASFATQIRKEIAQVTAAARRGERAAGTLVDDLLGSAKKLVMLPFAGLLDFFPKQVRDLAREEGKEIELVLRGREVEIDKRILEEMKDALIHLVRNSIDHGIEKPEARTARGKTPKGLLTIAVSQRDGSKVEIAVSDDGEGIDAAKVKASAIKSGAIVAAEVERLSDADALALIFTSGVSTSPLITEISGRGLGMAIVREKVEKLGGQIAIETELETGTCFRISLPVTLATFKGLLAVAGGQTFVLPVANVDRITRVRREEIKTVGNRETIVIEAQPVALAWLADVLGLPRREASPLPPFAEVMILGSAQQRIAFVIEEVQGEQEVLVKKLAHPLVRVRNIAAATLLGSGTPALILNVADLLKSAVRVAASGRAGVAVAKPEKRTRRILVADDSVTSRMLLKNILETAGYRVTTAVDGLEAFTALRSAEFDLVVSDVEMPRMDGFELTEKIRAEKALAEMPVVLVTALGSREHRERGVDVGANAYIVKSSFDQSNLLEVIRRLE